MNGDISQIVSKIMSNPEFGNMVKELKSQNPGTTDGPAKEITVDDLMKKLPDIMGKLGGAPSSEPQAPVNLPAADAVKIEKALGALKKMDNQKCEKLLCALKPYLNRERGEVIDKAMSVMKITDILGAVQESASDGGE